MMWPRFSAGLAPPGYPDGLPLSHCLPAFPSEIIAFMKLERAC